MSPLAFCAADVCPICTTGAPITATSEVKICQECYLLGCAMFAGQPMTVESALAVRAARGRTPRGAAA